MSVQRYPMTQEGALLIKAELESLKNVERRRIIQAIAESRLLGDLKENAEYHAAKEEQGFIEGRINELEAKLSAAQIIDITSVENDGKVIFGATVTLVRTDLETGDEKIERYKIVGDDEVNIRANKISFNSPLARAIIGKMKKNTVEVNTPSGDIEYYIDQVEYI
ncbi:MAG: transcription elongation factor GreA [Gammaproteobacteria bacterium]|nr:transcription elongation factor GreA [Gammaproteobacteria bacterium]